MRAIIAEKNISAHYLLPLAATIWPDEDIVHVSSHFAIFSQAFSFPSRLTYKRLPLLVDPHYETRQWFDSNPMHTMTIGQLDEKGEVVFKRLSGVASVKEFFATFDAIVFGGDWDYSAALSYCLTIQNFMPKFFGTEATAIKIINRYEAPVLHRKFEITTTASDEFQKLQAGGKLKRYFEYNFQLNGNVIFGDLYRHLTEKKGSIFISKYMILILFYMQKSGIESYRALIENMDPWKGKEGSEGPVVELGSPASRHNILHNLVDLGLLDYWDAESLRYSVTDLGRSFLVSLHKDCYDPYLPQRILRWQSMPYEVAKPLIDTYLTTYFQKQKRFQAKIIL